MFTGKLTKFYVSTEVIFGTGCLESIDFKEGSKILIIISRSAERNKYIKDSIINNFIKRNITFQLVYTDKGEPTTKSIDSLFEKINKDLDVILAIGGGSVIDAAKFIAVHNENKSYQFVEDLTKGKIEQTEFYSDTTINWILNLKGFIPYVYLGTTLSNIELTFGFNPRVSLSSNPLPVYPMSIYTSFALFRPSPLMDRATFEFIYRFYEKAGYLTDGFTVLTGLEHTAYNDFFFALKAGIEKTYLQQDTYIPVYQIVFGQSFAGIKISGGLEYQNVKYSRHDSDTGEYAGVSENTLRFNVGLKIKP